MPNLIPFKFEQQEIRVVQNGQTWFVAQDVCRALGLSDTRRAVEPLDDDEKGRSLTPTPSGEQEMLTVTESGLYTLILRSRKATTPGTVQHRFRKFVTNEVLPALRQHMEARGIANPLTDAVESAPQVPANARMRDLVGRADTDAIDARLARLEQMLDTALTYKTGDDKGGTKDVATGRQVGHLINAVDKQIIPLLEKLTSAETITLTPTELPAIPAGNRTPMDEIGQQIFLLVHTTDHNQRFLKGQALGAYIRKTLQDIEVNGSAMLAAVDRMIQEAVKNSAAYEQAERNRLRAERAEREAHGLKSALGRILKIEADTKQPVLAA